MQRNALVWFALGAAAGWVTAGRGEKGSDLRLFDVLVLGPWLAYLATQKRPLYPLEAAALAVTAGATITHNGRNWLTAQRGANG